MFCGFFCFSSPPELPGRSNCSGLKLRIGVVVDHDAMIPAQRIIVPSVDFCIWNAPFYMNYGHMNYGVFPSVDFCFFFNTMNIWLVVSIPLKNVKVNWDDEIPNIWKNIKCSKPPTRYIKLCVHTKKNIRDSQYLFAWTAKVGFYEAKTGCSSQKK